MKALIIGVTGQDGSYLTEFLLEKGYTVYGTMRKASQFNTQRVDHLYQEPWAPGTKFFLRRMDLTDHASIRSVIQELQPDEIYNLGAQSHVHESFKIPQYTYETIANGTLALLEAVREVCPKSKFYQASSSEMFGDNTFEVQNESTPFHPRSPYGCAKVAAYYQTVNHREAYGMFCSNGILFNHESPRRSEVFVTRKITRAATRIKLGLANELRLGNLSAIRDWGFSGDYVRAMWMILQEKHPDDFVIATGIAATVKQFLDKVFGYLEMDYRPFLHIDPRLMRPAEVNYLCGDARKAVEVLGWKPTVDLDGLVKMMVDSDMRLAKRELFLKENGL